MLESPPRKPPSTRSARQPRSTTSVRQRKWHPRVFTGCLNCRKRHVKCDEQTPSCANCTRLSMTCTFSLTFVPLSVDQKSSTRSAATSSTMASQGTSTSDLVAASSDNMSGYHELNLSSLDPLSYLSIAQAAPVRDSMDGPLLWLCLPAQVQCSPNAMYYQHYLVTVSTLLIIFDTPCNSNPYRELLSLVGNEHSALLQGTMEALGAMHLAGLPQTQNRSKHRTAAINMYAGVVTQLRQALILCK